MENNIEIEFSLENMSFDVSDMVSFGEYLLSKERKDRLKRTLAIMEEESGESLCDKHKKEYFREIYDADIAIWLLDNSETLKMDNE